jgi:serine/threonine protein kinase
LTPAAGAETTRDDVSPSHIGKYEVQRRLGAGGMGSVYLARDPGLERLVAVKQLKDDNPSNPELRERFIREARSVARLRHENIIIVFDIGEADGLPFMAMEYIAGDTVQQVVRRSPTPPLTRRLTMAEELCAGLAHAHAAGIIHRDIKPANLMITGEGVLKILDFGIARLEDSGMTQGGMMLGSLNYMSPEQAAGPTVDHRSDIFATGAVLYELITLEQAFPGNSYAAVLNRILYEAPTPIEQRVPGIDPELAAIVRRALQRDPADRYQRASDMGRELARVRRRLAEAPVAADPPVTENTTVAERPRPSSGVKKSDSSRPKVLTPERFAELQRQQVEEHLRFGEAAFARGDHDGALHYGERAAMVDPESRAAIELINRARFAIESKAIRALLGEAERQLADGRIEDAASLISQAGADLPQLDGADDLRGDLRRISEEIAQARERERRINTSLDRARASMEQGGYETALRALYEVLALDPDRTEARELEQSAISQLQAQREHQRARKQAYDRLASARHLADEGRYDDALAAMAGVDGPSDTVRSAAAAAMADVRSQQRRAHVAAVVADARTAFEQGEFERARTAIDAIPQNDLTPEARALRADADRALRERIDLERKQRAVDDGLRAVAALVERNDLTGAGTKLDEVERIGLADPRVKDQRAQVTALIAAAHERRRQEARDRLASKLVEAARQLLENGDGHAAISLLERDSSGHALVSDALRDVRATVAEQEERARQEAERRRQDEEARRRAEIAAARRLEEARLAGEQRKREEARRAQEADAARRREEVATLLKGVEHAIEEADPDQATVLLTRAANLGRVDDSALAARAAAARAEVERLEHERAEQARCEEVATLLKAVEHAIEKADPEQATVLLKRADNLGRVDDSALAARAAAARAEVERLQHERAEQARREAEARQREEAARRRADEERQRAEEARKKETTFVENFERAKQTVDHEAALRILQDALAILPGDRRAEAVVSERRAALEAERAEAARLAEEARRKEEERREREAAVTRILSREQQEEPEAALTMLQDALTLVPGDRRVEARIKQRNADVDRQRVEAERQRQIGMGLAAIAEALDRQELDEAEQLLKQAERDFAAPPFKSVRLTYQTLRREEARARKESEDSDRRRQEQQAREEKEEAARRRRAEKAAQKAASGEAAAGTPAWTRYAAAAAVALMLVGAGVWAFWPRSSGTTPDGPHIAGGTQAGGGTVGPDVGPASRGGGPQPPAQPPSQLPPPPPRGSGTGPDVGRGGRDTTITRGGDPGRGGAPPDTVTPPSESAAERLAREQAERDRLRDQAERDRIERDRIERDRINREQAERIEQDRVAREVELNRQKLLREQEAQAALTRERTAIQQILSDYVDAYNALDEPRLRRVVAGFTGIPGRALIRSVAVRLSNQQINISPDLQTATVTATQNFEYVWNRAGADRTATGQLNWRLRKTGGTWMVLP